MLLEVYTQHENKYVGGTCAFLEHDERNQLLRLRTIDYLSNLTLRTVNNNLLRFFFARRNTVKGISNTINRWQLCCDAVKKTSAMI